MENPQTLFDKAIDLIQSGAEYEDVMDFFTYEVMNQSKSKLEAFLELCVGLLQDKQAEEEWIEYALLFIEEAKYSPALPAIFDLFADYEVQNWSSGWGMRETFYRTLQQIGGEVVHQFLREKQAMEREPSLQKRLENYLRNR